MDLINPATEEVIGRFPEQSKDEIDGRLAGAAEAFADWKDRPLLDRTQIVRQAGELLTQRRELLATTAVREMGKCITEALAEVDKCAAACTFFADHAERFTRIDVENGGAASSEKCYVRYDPIGVVLAIMPWNFPYWQVIRFAAPALAAGNVGLLKHASNVPGCAVALEQIFLDAGAPRGVFSALYISDNRTVETLVEHPAIRAVTLTGSDRAGRAVAAAAGRTLKKTVLELGGSDPFIVLDDADASFAAAQAAVARCINSGQSCIAAKRFIVTPKSADPFEQALVEAMRAMTVGDPADASTQVGPLARKDLRQALDDQVKRSLAAGAKALCGGVPKSGRGFFYIPTVLTGVAPGMPAFDEETFGPVAAVIRADDERHAIKLANRTRFGLGASLWTRDTDRAEHLARQIDAGCVFINAIVKSDPRLAFGGVKDSGYGRELAAVGMREFLNIKTVWVSDHSR